MAKQLKHQLYTPLIMVLRQRKQSQLREKLKMGSQLLQQLKSMISLMEPEKFAKLKMMEEEILQQMSII